LGENLNRTLDLTSLLKRLVDDLTQRAHLEWAGVWLYEVSENRFSLRQASSPPEAGSAAAATSASAFTTADPVIQLFSKSRELLTVQDAVVPSDDTEPNPTSDLSRAAASALAQIPLAAALPVHQEERLIGMIGLGPKRDRSLFHQADRDVLTELGRKAERAISQTYTLYERSLVVSKLAHDTLNFLHAQGMALGMLHDELAGPLNNAQKKQLELALQQQDLVRESLVDLRELERLVVLRMQGAWRMERYRLEAVAQEAVQAQGSRAKAQSVALECVGESIPYAFGDPRAVRRVLDNLVINALKFTPPGGRVRVELRPAGENIRLIVSDTGPGIAADEMPRLFDPFYQAPGGRKSGMGTGLGLSIVREVTSLHRGRLKVESTVGIGTAFIVELPAEGRAEEFMDSAAEVSSHAA
jgi:signal transduction histidine kinase